jgi:hypothetical protein
MNTRIHFAVAAALGLYVVTVAADDAVAEATHEARIERAEADHKVAIATCDPLTGNAKDICEARADLVLVTAKSNAKAKHEGTAEAHAEARQDIADAELALARQKCDEATGNAQDVCVKEAELKHTSATTAIDANDEVATAVDERTEEVRDAQYTLAMEKCEPLRGDAQDRCEAAAKVKFPEPD